MTSLRLLSPAGQIFFVDAGSRAAGGSLQIAAVRNFLSRSAHRDFGGSSHLRV
jgi:hypothetical protein